MRKREAEKENIRAAAREYGTFKRQTMQRNRKSIWRDSGKIHFYYTVMEYFWCCQDRNGWGVLEGITLPVQAMWNCYLKYEHLEYATWQGIEQILEQMGEDFKAAEMELKSM